ncbi:hypothetical protein [Brevibacillus laterosporus]|uniref:hypothetical protein n=1 Tax=Brevibacillus laterosporus TaxID=1465 RepID=UPI003D1C7F69
MAMIVGILCLVLAIIGWKKAIKQKRITPLILLILVGIGAISVGFDNNEVKKSASSQVPLTQENDKTTPLTQLPTTQENNKGTVSTQLPIPQEDADRFPKYVKNIKGSPFIKSASLKDNEAIITYFSDSEFEDYKKANPKSRVTLELMISYWEGGDAINKILMGEPIRLLREFPSLKSVTMSLNIKKKTYFVNIDRKTAEEYFKINLDELHADKSLDKWRDKFVDPFVYTPTERKKFAEKFIKSK